MPKSPKTDLQALQALLTMPDGKLTASEKKAFQGMYDNLASGRVIKLSMRQRTWVDEIYDRHDLDKERPATTRKVSVKDRSLLTPIADHPLDTIAKNRPLKPPGRA